jgi:curved DNA-binding protein
MPAKYKDYYATLGVGRDASDADIKKAFRKLAREHHPDVAKNKKQAEEKFKEINEAYEVLSDPAKRKRYDQLGPGWQENNFGGPGGQNPFAGGFGRGAQGQDFEFQFGGTGFSDFFEQLFGARSGGARQSAFHGDDPFGGADERGLRGRDIEGDIMVTLDEVTRGSVRSVSIRHSEPCRRCGGTGRQGRDLCPLCAGSGQLSRTDTHQVKIPAGVTEGQRLRVAGRGEAGAGGGSSGDLFLRVRLAKHPDFEVEDHNLVHTVDLAPWEAVLGASISVPTLDGRVNIRIPPGTKNGQKLRVRGRGLPDRKGDKADLIVITRIEMPDKVGESERKLWEQLARESGFRPRG